jgi:hypothetical protein
VSGPGDRGRRPAHDYREDESMAGGPDSSARAARVSITPAPAPEMAAAIVAALHHHRRRAVAIGERAAPDRWQLAGRQAALRADWPARRAAGWRWAGRW